MADGKARREVTSPGIRLVMEPEIDTDIAESRAAAAVGGRVQPLDESSPLGHPLSSVIGSGWAQLAFSALQEEGAQDVLQWQVVPVGKGASGEQLVLVPNRLHWDLGRGKQQALYRIVHVFTTQAQPGTPPVIRTPPPAAPPSGGGVYIPPPPQPPPAGNTAFQTFEIYGVIRGQNVPLSRVVEFKRNFYNLVRGGRVLVGDSPTEGFGYGGSPGRWTELFPGVSPSTYGQDPDRGIVGFDGRRPWPIPAKTLNDIFGYNWRRVIYPLAAS